MSSNAQLTPIASPHAPRPARPPSRRRYIAPWVPTAMRFPGDVANFDIYLRMEGETVVCRGAAARFIHEKPLPKFSESVLAVTESISAKTQSLIRRGASFASGLRSRTNSTQGAPPSSARPASSRNSSLEKASVGRASVGRASVGRASVGRASIGRSALAPASAPALLVNGAAASPFVPLISPVSEGGAAAGGSPGGALVGGSGAAAAPLTLDAIPSARLLPPIDEASPTGSSQHDSFMTSDGVCEAGEPAAEEPAGEPAGESAGDTVLLSAAGQSNTSDR